MFQIESNNSWYYEISNREGDMYLYTGYASMTHGSWHKKLMPSECYVTVNTAIAIGDSLNHILAEMTKYRRHICGLSRCDKHLPSIFNEYMHLSWDSPTEENIAFPGKTNSSCSFDDNMLKVDFAEGLSAVFLEIDVE